VPERVYPGAGIEVRYDAVRCRHVEACVHGLPRVFAPGRRPWIVPDEEADPGLVAEVVRRCPTGALHYTLVDGPVEEPAEVTTVTPLPDGPVLVRGDLRLEVEPGRVVSETRAALCRCGASENKPFCDGSHERIGWRSG
jgi:uncharacterized Fe-S cluster protein YjdI